MKGPKEELHLAPESLPSPWDTLDSQRQAQRIRHWGVVKIVRDSEADAHGLDSVHPFSAR